MCCKISLSEYFLINDKINLRKKNYSLIVFYLE